VLGQARALCTRHVEPCMLRQAPASYTIQAGIGSSFRWFGPSLTGQRVSLTAYRLRLDTRQRDSLRVSRQPE